MFVRMNLRDLPFHVGDPVDALLGFHRRIERQLAALGALPARIEACGLDAEASAHAASALAFFRDALATHHADEAELLTLLAARVRSQGRNAEFDDLRQRLESEHRQMAATWRGLERPLTGIAEGVARRLPPDLVHFFRAMHAGHIAEEEGSLHVLAARALHASDRNALARGMAARRARRLRYQ